MYVRPALPKWRNRSQRIWGREKHYEGILLPQNQIKIGSVARGENREDSDIDIYYEGKELGLKSIKINTDLKARFEQPVDVVRLHKI